MREGSGQTQEAELIGSTRISMGMCDQSLLPRAFPTLHLPLLLLIRVCLIVPAQGSPQFPLTSWPLLPVRCVNAAFNQFYCLMHTHTHTHTRQYSWPYPSPLSRARFIKISPQPGTRPGISYSQTTREHGHVALSFALYWGCLPVFVSTHKCGMECVPRFIITL